MWRFDQSPLLLLLFLSACGGAMTSGSQPAATKPSASTAKPTQPVSLADVGLDASKLDRAAEPCQDFFRYACGAWLDRTEIPKDKAQYGTFNVIYDRNEALLRDILETAAKQPSSDPVLQKLGAFYGACMDEPAIEKAGTSALAPLFAITRQVKDPRSLIAAIGQLHASGVPVLFSFNPTQDKKDATHMIAQIGQSGLGLPDRDYYVDDDPDKRALRDAYVEHVEQLFTLSGRPAAKQAAAHTLAIETALAKTQKTRVELRDETGTYNRIDRDGLAKLAPLPWELYFERLGQPDVREINTVSVPYVEAFARLTSHELTHGFDDRGAQYDGAGNLSGWWPESVTSGFESRTQCIADFYSQYEPLPGIKLNGQLTLGENIADMGGVKLAFAAYRAAQSGAAVQQVADGFSEDQQFFLAVGQAWCTKSSPELERMRVAVDVHSSPRFRVSGALANLPEFAAAWQCAASTPMRPAETCAVW